MALPPPRKGSIYRIWKDEELMGPERSSERYTTKGYEEHAFNTGEW